MLLAVIIAGAIAIICAMVVSNPFDKEMNVVILCVLTAVIAIVVLGVGVMATHDTDAPDTTVELHSISTGTSTSGTFFLGSGGFGSDAQFYWYESNNGTYTMEQAYADDVQIVEREGTPEVVYHNYYEDSRDWLTFPFHFVHEYYYDYLTFYVPPGSVADNIDLSLPKG